MAGKLRRWYRTGGGRTVHRETCHIVARSKTAVWWAWAEKFDSGPELLAALGQHTAVTNPHYRNWNRACSHCKPFDKEAI
jgi:hypothetical protein